ncbi:hypothetical protein GCM10022381_32460 [Leifsonia kafniensis]|uniref:TIGR02677 family protein n=1 Tax=Leifsonia kafniensis TaxID=475957 RepID=A0ABP7KU43_9MICO
MTTSEASDSFSVFSHLNAQNAALYRRVLGAFVTAKQSFRVHLRPDDVLAVVLQGEATTSRTPPAGAESLTIEAVTGALESLVAWGNLVASPDTGRVVQVEDFYRKRHLFQLSREGEAVEQALTAYDEALGRRGALQAVALADITVAVRELLALVEADELDLGKLQSNLDHLTTRFGNLADNASAFMASLQRTIDLTDTDEETFIAYKNRLIEYLHRFIRDLAVRGPQIATLLLSADADRIDRAFLAIAERDAAEAAPDPDDPEARVERDRLHSLWQNRWAGLCGWFLSASGRDSQAKLLRLSALAAVPALLDAVRAINARRSGRSDRSADYLRLAQWFQEADGDDDRHRLARAAFGLYSARHLTLDAETWQRWSDHGGHDGIPWADAPPLEVSPQLRRTGRYERSGRPSQVIDRSVDRAILAQKVREQAEQIAAARRRLATNDEVELRELAGLDSTAFGLFLTLLGDALVSRAPGSGAGGVVGTSTASSDGTMQIDLTPLPGDAFVALETERGTLWGPNHLVRIRDLTELTANVAAADASATDSTDSTDAADAADADPADAAKTAAPTPEPAAPADRSTLDSALAEIS